MQFHQNISLKELHTFGVEVKAKLLAEITSEDEIIELFESPEFKKNNWLILGEGSDILFTKDFDGLIIKDNIKGIDQVYENEKSVWVKVSSGENWHSFVGYCVNKNWGGIENLALIPGTVGASPIQNIGAYGAEVKDSIHSLEVINLKNGKQEIFLNDECDFGYRWSIFKEAKNKGKYYISSVTFQLTKNPIPNLKYKDVEEEITQDEPTIADVFHAVVSIRKRKLPDYVETGNAGSFFKNPYISISQYTMLKESFPDLKGFAEEDRVKLPAAQLIDLCGWKGVVEKQVGVYQNQALVLCNYGGAKGKDILEFSRKIQDSVKEKFDVEIIPEVNIY
ncbi:UDP-N-acetylmuramate dehydrogenase [Bacteroidota bacterium]